MKLNEICSRQIRFMGSSTSKMCLWPELRPGPAGGAYSAPPDHLAGGSPTPALASRPFGPRAERSHCSHFTKRPLERISSLVTNSDQLDIQNPPRASTVQPIDLL